MSCESLLNQSMELSNLDLTLTLFVPMIFAAIFLYVLYGVIYRAVKNAIRDARRELDQTELPGHDSGGNEL